MGASAASQGDQRVAGQEDDKDGHRIAGRQFIAALARGLDVLGAFRAGDPPLSNQELARRCNLPRPTISRITRTLTDLGHLSYRQEFGCYELGGAMLGLGQAAKLSFAGLAQARPLMDDLAEFSNANVGIGTRDRLNMLYVTVRKAPSGIGLRFETGSKTPMVQTAMGRAYLASIDDVEQSALVMRLLEFHSHDARLVRSTLAAAIMEYKSNGFCSSVGNWHEDVNGIAAPIAWPSVADTLVLNCGAPASLMPKDRMISEVGPRLVTVAQAIGNLLERTDCIDAA